MGIEVNFDGVEAASGYEPLPEGTYTAFVDGVEEKPSSGGTPGFIITFRVVSPPEYRNRTIIDRLWITEKAMGFVRAKLETLGVQIPAGRFVLHEGMMISKPVRLVLRHEPYEDRDGNPRIGERVKAWEPATDVKPELGDDIPF